VNSPYCEPGLETGRYLSMISLSIYLCYSFNLHPRKRMQHVKYLEHTLLTLRMNNMEGTKEIKSVVIHG
jgi:hypothetical protein